MKGEYEGAISRAEEVIEAQRRELQLLKDREREQDSRYAREYTSLQHSYETDVKRLQDQVAAKDAAILEATKVIVVGTCRMSRMVVNCLRDVEIQWCM